eukprot:gnl/MRDRNA2_/MRDRNA2_29528_c0_seq2.p1 gnl/MRDRNA2_/MRDRNA2_29528_c0~~gnl/MRDRNA2_/MRDRNA2_29528_c0_seq2.p1  ORF type:complete len:472 (-),score=161.07 gnl/MRDRNA2_/MRDRNA2_29528_c0_seq2:533-1885(-)
MEDKHRVLAYWQDDVEEYLVLMVASEGSVESTKRHTAARLKIVHCLGKMVGHGTQQETCLLSLSTFLEDTDADVRRAALDALTKLQLIQEDSEIQHQVNRIRQHASFKEESLKMWKKTMEEKEQDKRPRERAMAERQDIELRDTKLQVASSSTKLQHAEHMMKQLEEEKTPRQEECGRLKTPRQEESGRQAYGSGRNAVGVLLKTPRRGHQEEAERKRSELEAECKKKVEEAKRKGKELEADRKIKELEAEQKAKQEEAESKRKEREVERKRQEEEAERKRKSLETEQKRKEEEAECMGKELEAERKRKEEDAECKRIEMGKERKRKEVEAEHARKQEDAGRKQKELEQGFLTKEQGLLLKQSKGKELEADRTRKEMEAHRKRQEEEAERTKQANDQIMACWRCKYASAVMLALPVQPAVQAVDNKAPSSLHSARSNSIAEDSTSSKHVP